MLQVLPEYIPALYQRFHAKKWEKFNSEKVCNISYARIQGKSSLIHHFSNSSLLHEDKRCRPIIFRSDGRLAGEQEPFPVASHVSAFALLPQTALHAARLQSARCHTPQPSPAVVGWSTMIACPVRCRFQCVTGLTKKLLLCEAISDGSSCELQRSAVPGHQAMPCISVCSRHVKVQLCDGCVLRSGSVPALQAWQRREWPQQHG